MLVDVCLERFALDVFFSLGLYRNDSFFCLDREIYLALRLIGRMVEGGDLNACELLVDVALRESTFELLEDVVANQHLGRR